MLRQAEPAPSTESRRYRSFDGGVSVKSSCFAPDRYRFWDDTTRQAGISRGAGLSYSAASFSQSVPSVEHCHFNRLLDFDSETNILEVESGVTLGQLYQFAAPRGLFVSVQPGHPRITVGGCIGADVHGKNQFRDGTFREITDGLQLFHPSHGIVDLSRSDNPDIFSLTCGGYGLTGNILTARLRLTPMVSSRVLLDVAPVTNIYEFAADLEQAAAANELVYSWHDFTARGKEFGRGHIVTGTFDKGSPASKSETRREGNSRLDSAMVGRWRICLFNRLTTPVFNRLYRASFEWRPPTKQIPLYDFLFPVHNKEVYFHLFGKVGFHECQILVGPTQFNSFVEKIQKRLEKHPVSITLASAKLFRGRKELLRFTGDGICMALNFPRNRQGTEFASFLDELLIEHGGLPNLIKDSRLSARVVDAAYSEYGQFNSRLRDFDPRRLYRSELSERLHL